MQRTKAAPPKGPGILLGPLLAPGWKVAATGEMDSDGPMGRCSTTS